MNRCFLSESLIMHTYQEELVNQQLGTEITEEEIEKYYQQNVGMFRRSALCCAFHLKSRLMPSVKQGTFMV